MSKKAIATIQAMEYQGQQIEESNLETILKDFRRDGYVVLKEVFSKEFINKLYLAFMSRYEQSFTDKNAKEIVQVGDKRYQIAVEVKGVFNSPELYANPFVFPIIEQLFDGDFIIGDLTCVTSLPGAKTMAIHCDGRIFTWHPLASLLPPHAVGALIPLIPFNQLNGPTRVWPGSQKSAPDSSLWEDKSNFIDLEVDTGSCILMDHRILHSGNPNLSEQIRPLLYINYSAPWYYDPVNFTKQAPLVVDDADFEQIPEKYRKLFIRRQIKPAGSQ
jgi:ectoine hydroxylase-related dioxygenase (phytanoyl-CoA dioxygenase family)